MHRGIRIFLIFFMSSLAPLAIAPDGQARDANAARTNPSETRSTETRLPPAGNWQTLTHDRLGFKIDYPANLFQPADNKQAEAGYILVSHDGRSKLLIAAFDNDEHTSLRDYRAHVLESSYAGAEIDYAPVRGNWFVLSGTRNDTVFYERVSFTCSGRRITSWAMLYPHEQQDFYNPVLEMIARTFRPSHTSAAGC